MFRFLFQLRPFFVVLLLTTLCLRMRGELGGSPSAMAFASVMPPTVLWAWEEPEDLRGIDTGSIGVAYLAETLLLNKATADFPDVSALRIRPRRQPLKVAPGTAVMAVVRLIAQPDFQDSIVLRHQTASALAAVAQHTGIRALQIDFDVTRTQRSFYAAVLNELRPQMPSGMPLSITALVSWCQAEPGDWMQSLPINEAVPMFFRLGGNALPGDNKSGYAMREPHCQSSVGISTDESWPPLKTTQRIYLFAPQPWTQAQLTAVPRMRNSKRPEALEPTARQLDPRHRVNDTGLHSLGDAGEEN
jgi:hypothetical protein